LRVSSIRWGVIWVGIGLLFLALNLELLDSLVFPRLFSLWPVLLIAIGVELIFRKTKLYFLALLSPVLVAAAFILAAYSKSDRGWEADQFWKRWVWQAESRKVDITEIPADSSAEAMELNLSCGPSRISFHPSGDLLFKATTEYHKRSPWIEHTLSNGIERIEFTNRERTRLAIFGVSVTASRTSFQITDKIPLRADITALDDEPLLDFSGLRLSTLNLDIRANSTSVSLGNLQDTVDITISGRSPELNFEIPESFALGVFGDSLRLARILKDTELRPQTSGYFSGPFEKESRHVSIHIKADVKSMSIVRR